MAIILKRGTSLQLAGYIGEQGTIAFNTETGYIHLQDGITPGGKVLKPTDLEDSPEGLHVRVNGEWVPLDSQVWDSGNIEIIYNLYIQSQGNGTITPEGSLDVLLNTELELVVTPNEGHHLAGVDGIEGTLIDNTFITDPIKSNALITATFAINTYTVTASSGVGGSVNQELVIADYGSTVNFVYTPLPDYKIDTVTGCSGSLNGSTYTTGPITFDCSVAGTFTYKYRALFYGGATDASGDLGTNTLTRIDEFGLIMGTETNIGSVRYGVSGGRADTVAVFYGGTSNATFPDPMYNVVTRIAYDGVLVGSETNAGTARTESTGTNVSTNAIFVGGFKTALEGWEPYDNENLITRINSSGAQVGAETSIGAYMARMGAVGSDTVALFTAGSDRYDTTAGNLRRVLRIDSNGVVISNTVYSWRLQHQAGASIDGVGLIYGGAGAGSKVLFKWNFDGTLLATYTTLHDRYKHGGAGVNNIAVFYGGVSSEVYTSLLAGFNSNGVNVWSDSYLGTPRGQVSGASL